MIVRPGGYRGPNDFVARNHTMRVQRMYGSEQRLNCYRVAVLAATTGVAKVKPSSKDDPENDPPAHMRAPVWKESDQRKLNKQLNISVVWVQPGCA